MAHLRLTSGPESGTRYPLDRNKTVLGRHPSCDIATDVNAVSRYHAQIVQRDDGFYIEDLNSRNGTFVNEQRVSNARRLTCDDVVRICDLIFVFHDEVSHGQLLSASSRHSPRAFLADDEPSQSSIRQTMDVSSQMDSISVSAETKLKALIEVSANLSRSVGYETLLPTILDTLFTIFPQADRGIIILADKLGELVPKSAKSRRESMEAVRVSRTILNYVIENRKAIISADAADDERFDLTESIAQIQIRSMMCAPLITADQEVLGAVHIDTLDPKRGFDDADLELLVAIVSQAALVVKNAELHEQALERKTLQRELELAHQVQMGLLPQKPPSIDGYQFADFYRPAKHIGGDYFDYVQLPDQKLAVIVADVSGHGPAAALLMTKLAAEARFCLASQGRPQEVLQRLNRLLCDDGVDDRFVTMVMTVLAPHTGELTIVNAGHMPPLCADRGGSVAELAADISGLPLGINQDFIYEQAMMPMPPGSTIALFTDGITEAAKETGEMFGFERLRQRIAAKSDGVSETISNLIDDVKRFTANEPQGDDICVVCLRRDKN